MVSLAPDSPLIAPGHRVLVADDEAGMREMLAMLLQKHGYQVTQAADGAEALTVLRERSVDLLLADVRMPKLSGIELVRAVRELKLPVTVIVMSAFVDIATAIAALEAGAIDYVSKPFRADEVLLKIRMAEERARLAEEHDRLAAENKRLRGGLRAPEAQSFGIIGKSPRITELLGTVRKIADYKTTVLLMGESGTGKELFARALHADSTRKRKPFVAINCGAIPETLLESELFGHARGAFTDATHTKLGLIEEAEGGTLFLDEIGELPLGLQVKLLRFLQEDEIRRVGETRDIKVDVRVVAATARDLSAMVQGGTFREDLFYRLNVLTLVVPPLRTRREDIPQLIEHFMHKCGARLARGGMTISRAAMRALLDYSWPGNVRELENVIERAMVLADGDQIEVQGLPERLLAERAKPTAPVLGDDLSIKRAVQMIERHFIARALEKTGGNRTRAAALLEISHRALLYKIKRFGLG